MPTPQEVARQNFDTFNGRFVYIRHIYQASQGHCSCVLDKHTKKAVCLKYASKKLIQSSQRIEGGGCGDDFLYERRILEDLSTRKNCPDQLCKFLIGFESKLNCYYTMEYCPNGALVDCHDWIKKIDDIENRKIVVNKIIRQVIYGLYFLHINNIYHRDLTWENILVANKMRIKNIKDLFDIKIKIIDLGGSKQFDKNTKYEDHISSSTFGKPAWRSPESFLNKYYHLSGHDIYCVGILLWVLLFDFPPCLNADIKTNPNDPRIKKLFFEKDGMKKLIKLWKLQPKMGKNKNTIYNILSKLICPKNKRVSMDELLNIKWFKFDKNILTKINPNFGKEKKQEKEKEKEKANEEDTKDGKVLIKKKIKRRSLDLLDTTQSNEEDVKEDIVLPNY